MHKKYREQLYADYPSLYRKDRTKGDGIFKGLAGEQVHVGDGWFEIVRTLNEKIDALNLTEGQAPILEYGVRQAGHMFVVILWGNDPLAFDIKKHIQALCARAELDSKTICEWCGMPGFVLGDDGGRVFCAECWAKVEKNRNEAETIYEFPW
jgi:hypothetical protein